MARDNGSTTPASGDSGEHSPSRSPSPRRGDHRDRAGSDGNDDNKSGKRYNLAIPVCKDFTRGRCARSQLECRYAHPPPIVEVDGEQVTVCYDSLRDRCARGYTCRYFHPPPHLRVKMQESIGIQSSPTPLGYQANSVRHSNVTYIPPALPPPLPVAPVPTPLPLPKISTRPAIEVCRDFLRGRCTREAEECRFAHHTPTGGDGEYAIVCQDFLRGKCTREACRYFHALEHLKSRIKDLPVGSTAPVAVEQGHHNTGLDVSYAYSTEPFEHQAGKRMRLDGSYDQHHWGSSGPYYGGGHGSSSFPISSLAPPAPPPSQLPLATAFWAPSAVTDQDKLPVCRDFLRDKCSRSMACRFVHPEPYTQVVDNYVTVCRDSLRGRCKREQCRFYHPPTKSASKQDNNYESSGAGAAT